MRGALFDSFAEIGGFLQDCGKSVARNGIYFPATRQWIIDDLTAAKHECERALEVLKTL
jgi:hypothetical protein